MPESRDIPLVRWGEQLRRDRNSRRRARFCLLWTAGAAVVAIAALATLIWPPRPAFVWNASPSSPLGLYFVGPAEGARPGDMVIAWPPDAARELGARRHYLPRNVPLVKRVAAAAGDRVCAVGEAIYVNGRLETLRRAADPSGRPMPWWTGCEDIADGDLFLLTSGEPDAFDGRYFGVTARRQIVGRARLIWPG